MIDDLKIQFFLRSLLQAATTVPVGACSRRGHSYKFDFSRQLFKLLNAKPLTLVLNHNNSCFNDERSVLGTFELTMTESSIKNLLVRKRTENWKSKRLDCAHSLRRIVRISRNSFDVARKNAELVYGTWRIAPLRGVDRG